MNKFIENHLDKLKKCSLNPELDLRILLNKSSIKDKEIILSNFNYHDINLKIFKHYFKRRIKSEPISKIFNLKSFWKYDFYVNSKVLDPRPETELITEKVLDLFPNKNQKLNILDMCTGSGCIAISLAREYLNSKIYATDLSLDAINVAKFNAERLNCLDQIKFVNCDLLDHYDKYDIIASNPPYLSETEYTKTSKEIRLYEPKIAFTSSQNGYNFYYRISKILPRIMHKKSLVFLEIGSSQAKKTRDIFKLSNIHLVKKIKDIQSFDRLLILNKP